MTSITKTEVHGILIIACYILLLTVGYFNICNREESLKTSNRLLSEQIQDMEFVIQKLTIDGTYEQGFRDGISRGPSAEYERGYHAAIEQFSDNVLIGNK